MAGTAGKKPAEETLRLVSKRRVEADTVPADGAWLRVVEVFGVGRGVESVLSVSCPARAVVLADPAVVTYVEQSVWLLRVVLSARFHPPLRL